MPNLSEVSLGISNYELLTDLKLFKAVKRFQTMQLGESLAIRILYLNDLEDLTKYYILNNQSKDLPYHNAYHAWCMVLNCYEAARYYHLSDTSQRSLLLAALFHDYGHSGGYLDDRSNVNIARKGLRQAIIKLCTCCNGFGMLSRVMGDGSNDDEPCPDCIVPPIEVNLAIDLIEVTKYPYEVEPKTLLEQIIRDADLMQVYERSAKKIGEQYLGLYHEIKINRPCTLLQFVDGNQKFQEAVSWHTEWAKNKASVLDYDGKIVRLRKILIRSTGDEE